MYGIAHDIWLHLHMNSALPLMCHWFSSGSIRITESEILTRESGRLLCCLEESQTQLEVFCICFWMILIDLLDKAPSVVVTDEARIVCILNFVNP